ncbi:MAG: hypothetical protein ACYTFI_08605 [Planctomycetota bacterium]|jgi:hypothetical protein
MKLRHHLMFIGAAVLAGAGVLGHAYVYTPWAVASEAEELLKDYTSTPRSDTARRMILLVEEGSLPRQKGEELLRAVLTPRLQRPFRFRIGEGDRTIRLQPALRFHRLVFAVDSSIHLDSWGSHCRPVGLYSSLHQYGGIPFSVDRLKPGHHVGRMKQVYTFYSGPLERIFAEADRSGEAIMSSLDPPLFEIALDMPFEFDVVAPDGPGDVPGGTRVLPAKDGGHPGEQQGGGD